MKPTPPMLELHFPILNEDQMRQRSRDFLEAAKGRRSIRQFSNRPVPREIIEQCLLAAGTAPSGANTQPWYFAVVESPDIKRQIRAAAEKEEQAFYAHKAPQDWLDALAPLGTNADKPFLETAPYLIAVFQQRYGEAADGSRVKHYYAPESVGIATGILVTALHHAGLACLTHTPSPMGFLNQILGRPKAERPFVLLVVGFPAIDAKVPDIQKKNLAEIASFL
ncbi:MAG: nitroreductase family protein [SAR86 cluster bacterium]|uniref:Nitroreductase family protein n=1 Tax=SAR86 cluster bacterium TaxID=2030880 RepID=A0A972VV30_9GAMM|nr:nitroreductase family protein [SAR86 cluster bacterium]